MVAQISLHRFDYENQAMYKITFKESASKELQCLSKTVVTKIAGAINGLSENPRPAGCKET